MSVTTGVRRRRRRTSAVSAAVLAVAALVITGFAVAYDGLSSSDVEVNDGGVWVTNDADGMIGRINVDAEEFDARLATPGDAIDVLQSGYHVLVMSDRGYKPVNTAGVETLSAVELPVDSHVGLGGDRVAIAAGDGRVWILTPQQAAAFSPATAPDPAYTASGRRPVVSVGTDGTVFVLDGGSLIRFPRTEDTTKPAKDAPAEIAGLSEDEESVELTVVGEDPVILDREASLLRIGMKGTEYDLNAQDIDPSSARLQQPGDASPEGIVVLATSSTLVEVPLNGSDATAYPSGGTGEPVAPVQISGCAYGAWNGANTALRACAGDEGTSGTQIEGAEEGANLTLRVNQDLVVLNDRQDGKSWKIQDEMQLVDDWEFTQDIETDKQQQEDEETLTSTITNVEAERSEENQPPTANPDAFGVRAGGNIVLPVVRNDTDPDGDLLTAKVVGDQPGIGAVTPIRGGTQLQVTVDEDATGAASFTYEVDDGRGGKATATVDLTVQPAATNTGPRPADEDVAATKIQVRSGQSVSFNILPYYQDDEGDAFYLSNATMDPEDTVTFTADGLITVNDAGKSPGEKSVSLSFVDEHGETGEGTLIVESVTDDELPPLVTADHAHIAAGRSVTLKPLLNDVNPNGGDLELLGVTPSQPDGLDVTMDAHSGTVTVRGETEGSFYIEYTVGSGAQTASSLIRVDVSAPTEEALKPVAVDDMAMVTTGRSTLVDPLENDVDPSGGVLVLNSVEVPPQSGLKATILDHHLLRIEAEPGSEAATEPVPITYEVANGTDSATGTVRAMVVHSDTQFAIPIAVPDSGVVRAGDVISLDVLANDSSPTGSPLHVKEVSDPSAVASSGTLEVVQDAVRFTAAPDATGEVSFEYTVIDETGREDAATVTLRIVPADGSNDPPRPPNIEARTVAGTPVRIPVPTSGVDDEGDSVLLMGISSPTPQLGTITESTGQWLEYTPAPGQHGTDTFRYQVMDRQGAVGTGEISVGIAEPAAVNLPPAAVDDTVEVRPDRIVQIPVLDNDSDPEGAPLSIDRGAVQAQEGLELIEPAAGESSPFVTVRTPKEPGTYQVTYAASDGIASTPATAIVKVDGEAPLRAPVAVDDFVDAAEVLDPEAETVEVDALANDSDPDGSALELGFALEGSPEGVTADENGLVRITPQEEQQRIRYTITDVDDQKASGYIWVPGTAKQQPVWTGGTLDVGHNGERAIDLTDPALVRVRPGAEGVSISDRDAVSANHSDGSEIAVDGTNLLYRPQEGYAGPDTITVPVTDGAPGDATAATSTLTIPVEVQPDDVNPPPTMQGTVLRTEQGAAATTLDLGSLAADPQDEALTFSLAEPPTVSGVSVSLDGSTLTAQADKSVPKGTIVDVEVSASDGTNPPVTAIVQVSVQGSSKPLIATVLAEEELDAGRSGTYQVLENASNPFPGEPRSITGVGTNTPEVGAEVDGEAVTVTADPEFHGIATITYTVQDATGDPDRQVTGTLQVNVIGKPEAPSAPRILETGDGFVKLDFVPRNDNGAAVTSYTVSSESGPGAEETCTSTICTVDGLENDTEYTFQVVATNRVGPSDPSAPSATARPDVRPDKPDPPRATRGDGELTVAWRAPVNRGSAIESYDLQIRTGSGQMGETRTGLSAGETSLVWSELSNGTNYMFRVRAHNSAEDASDWSEWSSAEHPAGKPKKPRGTPTAERSGSGKVVVSWPGMSTDEANGEPITGFVVTASNGSRQRVDGGDSRSTSFTDLDPDTEYTFTYTGVNSVGEGTEASGASNAVTAWAKPAPPKNVSATMDESTNEGPDGTVTVSWDPADGNGTTIQDYVVTGGGREEVVKDGTSVTLSGLENGKAYTFTVQARNRFEASGGLSDLSKPSNSVTPYTKPAKPTVRSSAAACTGSKTCPVSFEVSANGDGGAGGIDKLEYNIDGEGWKTYSGPVKKTASSGQNVSFEARAWNTKGKVSDTVSSPRQASTYTAPEPKFAGMTVIARENNPPTCDSEVYCRKIDVALKDLDPNKTYTLTMYTNNADPEGWWEFARAGYGRELPVTPNADGTWSYHSQYDSYLYYGIPMSNVDVFVDGKKVGNFEHPDKQW